MIAAKMGKTKEVPVVVRQMIVEDRKSGLIFMKLADKYKLSFSGVRHICEKFEKLGVLKNFPRKGRI